ncbi:hypothetical protein Hanom_Chr05g00450321 [Helianthus anomalus]
MDRSWTYFACNMEREVENDHNSILLLLINQYSYLAMASGAGGKVSFKVIAPLIPSCQSKCSLSPPEGAPLVLLLNLLLNNSKFLNKLVLPSPTVITLEGELKANDGRSRQIYREYARMSMFTSTKFMDFEGIISEHASEMMT